ncbi:hypothetical protein CEXT_74691 [Caerostris extrusa]|uniref:Uncharacterized protein n=1 Tax=Caerostris extrusa TaxID=172846 RepID=A0AAV4T5S2_CAEEX|nr:hypothetical protein CEXT_74691 [Caerostris extrusa]
MESCLLCPCTMRNMQNNFSCNIFKTTSVLTATRERLAFVATGRHVFIDPWWQRRRTPTHNNASKAKTHTTAAIYKAVALRKS